MIKKGTIEYEIELNETEFKVNYPRTVDAELLGLMLARGLVQYSKTTLMNGVKGARGDQKIIVKDRIRKLTTTDYMLGLLSQDIAGAMMDEENMKEAIRLHQEKLAAAADPLMETPAEIPSEREPQGGC